MASSHGELIVQLEELKYNDGVLSCNRDEPMHINLKD
jgi:hypothetical protein